MKIKPSNEHRFPTQDRTFYKSVRKLLILGKLMGFIPIVGLMKEDSTETRGTWRSPYTFYYLHNTALRGFILTLLLINMMSSFKHNVNDYQNKLDILITSLALFLTVYMSVFCKNWRGMVVEVDGIERLIPRSGSSRRGINVNRVLVSMFIISAFEHIVYMLYTVHTYCVHAAAACSVRGYYLFYYDFTFNVVPFSYVVAVMMQISKLQRTFLIAYLDAMVVSVALYLMNRFKDFNCALAVRLKKCNYKKVQWTDLQAYYTRLAKLTRALDERYNTFVFMSFTVNLIYICKNIYVFIQYHRRKFKNVALASQVAQGLTWMEVFYLCTFNASLLMKALVTFTTTAYLHTLTRVPLNALHTIPAAAYSPQFQRFMDQVFQSKVHLSGLNMFYISRNTILSVISTVITYELVLIQLPDDHH